LAAQTTITSATSLSAAALRGLIQCLGSPDFPKQLLFALQALIDVRHLAIIAFDDQLGAHIIAAESLGKVAVAKAAGKIYQRSLFYRYDPNVRVIQADTEADEPLLLRLRAREITDAEYRSNIFDQFNLVDRLSILDHGSGHWLAINFYRESHSGEFDAGDIAAFGNAAGVIAALVARHFAIAPPASERASRRPSVEMFEALVGGLDERLTKRQVQVCARALMGMTNVAVGLSLGIQVPTVATLRKRAYATLKISSLNELFALCLTQTSAQS
jgi:DNA-binding CsgD family transcriptional regulator